MATSRSRKRHSLDYPSVVVSVAILNIQCAAWMSKCSYPCIKEIIKKHSYIAIHIQAVNNYVAI